MKHPFYWLLLSALCLMPGWLLAQPGADWWQPVDRRAIPAGEAPQELLAARSFRLNVSALQAWLAQAPAEHNAEGARLSIQLPRPDGSMARFQLTQTPVMAPALAARYPSIQTWAGKGVDDPTAMLRCDMTDFGFHAMIRGVEGTWYIEPAHQATKSYYQVFYSRDAVRNDGAICGVSEEQMPELGEYLDAEASSMARQDSPEDDESGDELLVYNLAVAADFPFCNSATAGNPTKSGVLSVVTTIINQTNGIYEQEATIRFLLNANTDDLFFIDQATDPYTILGSNGNSREMLMDNPRVIDSVLGINAYDIGHGFSRAAASGGITVVGTGYFRSVCGSGTGTLANPHRANGASVAIGLPQSIQFRETLTHEFGHQFNARHSFNTNGPSCGPARDPTRPFEPASGSTIMSYAGACIDNIQNGPDLYFNTGGYELIYEFSRNSTPCLESRAGTGNTAPTIVSTGISGTFLPIQTPFELTAEATDLEDANLTYCWEQANIGSPGNPNSPSGNAPIFRSFPATVSPTRVFPRLQSVINGITTFGETYPTYNRDLTFRLTVRDNHPGAGGLTYEEIDFDVTNSAGPFLVTSPNGQEVIRGGDIREVTWNPANTDLSPVNCSSVDIYLSTDGGFNYPYLLAQGVPNTGSVDVFMPDVGSSTARVKIKANNNVFFDLSDANFTLEVAAFPDVAVLTYTDPVFVCPEVSTTFPVYTSGIGGFNGPITVSASGLPPGVSFTTSPAQPSAGDTVLMTLTGGSNLTIGTGSFTVRASGAGGASGNASVNIQINEGLEAAPVLDGPTTGLTAQPLRPSFSWQAAAGALSYVFEVSSDPSFAPGSLIESAANLSTTSYTLSTSLSGNQVYFWRVGAINDCVAGRYSSPGAFQTNNCETYIPTDLPKVIPVNGAPQTVISSLAVPTTGTISSLSVQRIQGTHGNINDLTMVIRKAGSVQAELINRSCPFGGSNFNVSFADQTPPAFPPCPPTDGGVYQSRDPLSVFTGIPASGAYSLRVIDAVNGNGGQLNNWELEICLEGALALSVTTNDTLYLLRSEEKTIDNGLLAVSSPVSAAAAITYTLATAPDFGTLKLNGQALTAGDVFTQAGIDAGDLSYEQDGSQVPFDSFDFSTLDQDNGWSGLRTFNIRVTDVVSVSTPTEAAIEVYPNPTTGRLTVQLPALREQVTLTVFNQQGQALQSQVSQGKTEVQLSLKGYATGLYLLRVQAEGRTWVEKVQVK
jgi:hypothetical protein